jgi:flagellar motor switch protein FliM
MMNICFPTFALEDELAKINTQSVTAGMRISGTKKEWSKTLMRKISQTSIPVSAVLGQAALSVRELIQLEIGDVVKTKIPVDGEVSIDIGNATRFFGKPGVSHGNLAIQIERVNKQL